MIQFPTIRECDFCGKPFDEKQWNIHHDGHEQGCQNYRWWTKQPQYIEPCHCDLVYHDECCPDCK